MGKIEKIKAFEIEVIDNRTMRKTTYYLTYLESGRCGQTCETTKDRNDLEKGIRGIDNFSLDENLQCLYDACINAIEFSDFYILNIKTIQL